METLTFKKVVHLVGGKYNGVVTTQCGKRFDYDEVDFTPACSVNPTCPDCLKHHFNNLKTNHYYRKRADKACDRASQIMNGLSILIEAQRTKTMESKCEETTKGAYPFIPMSAGHILNDFNDLAKYLKKEKNWSGHKTKTVRFLDAGCGVGNILLIASICKLAETYHGIEYFKDTARRARSWLGTTNKSAWYPDKFKIFRKDILTFKNYSDYDIVYFYCPMVDGRLQIRFEERLEDEMKVGAILLPYMKRGKLIRSDKRFERIINKGSAWFIKVSDGPRTQSQIKEVDKFTRGYSSEREENMQKVLKAGTLKIE